LKFLPLTRFQGEAHTREFDAVSEDRKIACSIKTASWKIGGGKRGSGKIQGAYASSIREIAAEINPWVSLEFTKASKGVWLITMGPTIDGGETPGHFPFDSGSECSCGMLTFTVGQQPKTEIETANWS
jgi:hypothetical protein